MAKQTSIDITKTGPQGFRALQDLNSLESPNIRPEIRDFIKSSAVERQGYTLYNPYEQAPKDLESSLARTGTPWGESMFDENTATEAQFENLGDIRAENQPWYSKIGAGVSKGVILAGTTFLDGTIGLVLGAGQAIKEGRASALWDNDFSKAMQSVNEWSEQALPNYYTEAEKTEPWYNNIFTANFLGDKFIKNLGFTVGAFYSGGVASAGLKATKLPKLIGAIAKSSKAPAIVTSGLGATISAVNEGRIEALNNSTDWFELQKSQLDDQHNVRLQAIEQYRDTEMYYPLLAKENADYESALGKLTEDRLKMGNADLLMNLPILLASNLIQFGKLYANGYKTARKTTNIVGKAGEYATGKTTGKGIVESILSPLSEGTEELAQKTASVVSGLYYEDDVNNFYKAKIDPEAEQETLSWIKSFAEGINQTVNDGSSWEEFFIGTLTGALGMPRFRSTKNSEGKFQSPITLEGGIIGGYREYRDQIDRETKIADYMNNRVNSPEFLNYYQGLIRHNKYQKDMNQAVENGDEFEFKNAEHAQLVSDIIMFDNAGKLGDLVTLINSAFDTSDENLASIVENTTATLEDGSKVGPFIDKNGNPTYSTQEGRQEMVNKLTQTKDEIFNTITNYTKIKDDIDISTGQQLSDEQLQELAWLKSQINNWQDRASQLSSEVKPTIGTILGSMSQLANMYNGVKTEEGQNHAGLTDLYKSADNTERKLRKSMSILETVRSLDDKAFSYLLSNDPKLVEGIKSVLNDPISGISADEIQATESKIDDIVKLVNATNNFNIKLKEYLENPGKLQEDMVVANETVAAEEVKKKSDSLKDKLASTANLSEFKEVLNTEENSAIREETLKSLEDEGNQLAKNYREVNTYNAAVRRAIDNLDETTEVKNNALTLFNLQYENAENLKDIANPNSVYIDDKLALFDDSLTEDENIVKQQEAMYALLTAMKKVNNDAKFKSRFTSEYTDIKIKGKPDPAAPDSPTTGDSGTSTVPDTEVGDLPNFSTDTPIGNITSDMVLAENAELNSGSVDNIIGGDLKQYYRPAIPQLHIEGVKVGDFRPFNEVAKERRPNENFDVIYDYLRDNGAFDYVNSGNLKVGDLVKFKIDPAFEESMKSAYTWYTGPTIFMTTESGQVIGSLDAGRSVAKFEGLSKLEQRIVEEYNTKGEITTTTNVSKIMVGKIPYTKTERSLADIPGIKDGNEAPIFGIIKNGILSTNGKIADSQIIKPSDMANKEGRVYLLVPNAAGKYSPVAVRVKHFNKEEFDLNDITVSNTPIGRSIKEAIANLASATSQEEVSSAVKSLEQDLYFRDIMVTWFSANAGDGIVISKKVRKLDGSYETIVIDGKEHIKEEKHTVYFTTSKRSVEVGGIVYDAAALKDLGYTESLGTPKNPADIFNEILNTITGFNLPLQVSERKVNEGNYTKALINSNILTSNITSAEVVGSWFTTDYIDDTGVQQKAVNPVNRHEERIGGVTPVGGTESAIKGTPITIGSTTTYVDLEEMVIRDANGKSRGITNSDTLLVDLAWAQNTYGSATTGDRMWNNKVVTPEGRVLDRTTKKHLTGDAAQEVIDRVNGVLVTTPDAKKVVAQIEENQRKVDKEKTDGDYYYILEDDGKYHQYERVHTRLGGNWIMSKKQEDALKEIQTKLSQYADNPTNFKKYVSSIGSYYKVDLSKYGDSTDARSRMDIVTIIRDSMAGTRSKRALDAGSAVDLVIRDFFNSNSVPTRPSNISEESFTKLIETLTDIKANIEARGEKFITNNVVLFYKYADGTRVAGEVDILSVDKDGNFRIYDVKTSRYSFYDFTDSKGATVNYFRNKSRTQKMSNLEYYTLQLSAYKNLFESQYNAPVKSLGVLPFVLSYKEDNVSSILKEKGINITYNPSVNVPKASEVKASITESTTDTVNEMLNPINTVLPEYKMSDSEIGYFVIGDKVYRGYISNVGVIDGINIRVTKIPSITSGYGKAEAHVAFNAYHVVFPNGNTFPIIPSDSGQMSEQQVKDAIMKALSKNPGRVKQLASENTVLSKKVVDTNPSGAFKTTGAEASINNISEEFEEDLDLDNYREVDVERPTWNREKELTWLNEVLPQLSKAEAVKVVKGLIEVAGKGTYAWGKFSNGVMTLSDIAAEGTVYHEAFHVVFNLMLNNSERQALYNEAREIYGNKSDLELEEDMAEGFREYVASRDSRGIKERILDFFKNLVAKITNWKYVKPHLTSLYRMINEGKYSKETMPLTSKNNIKGKRLWHTSDSRIYRFEEEFRGYFAEQGGSSRAIFFADRAPESQSFLVDRKYQNQYDVDLGNSYIVEGTTEGKKYNQNKKHNEMQEAIKYAMENGYDSVIFKNMYDNMMYGDIYVVFDPMRVKYISDQDTSKANYGEAKFANLPKEQWKTLVKKGWTEEKWNSISQRERDQALECLHM